MWFRMWFHSLMSTATKTINKMRSNPRGDWRIDDVELVCRAYGLECLAPTRGDHYKVRHQSIPMVLVIPAHRPIKPVYIRQLVAMIDAMNGGQHGD